MSLPVLVVIVVLGIALSVTAVHFTGGSKMVTLTGADQAMGRFAEDFPDETATAVRLTADGRSAFLDLGHGRTGIVHGIGDCFLTRVVTPRDVVVSNADETDTIHLRLTDFTWKGGRFRFANAVDVQALLNALGPRGTSSGKEAA
ncbi:hypothetical protein FJ872_19105 [Mesorhizobium sp. B2-5-9]|uniref:hypothetical protein n=1 Tax=unclassified Mesorhizobium TaxID=325217 RepID=UPI0011286C25|nr:MULTISPECIES: hypothetical protein [unclassified Mesorhizobium]MBZ9933271.1 hypothetical protein [Mesorhizobium sp. BR1-1-5]MBZ9910390.1 hypothetical protein [Mesorhizobium sp. BR115XR7A]TPK16561.1 hypothetical protein FJ872_19105 [Mesorhizobium sp. B2-5-9]TPK84865.1 hypothetical protein FJ936_13360 [Mesorhizobium sp. B2-4-13]TPL87842.1 hypothetical protein FJ950_07100 [Mesorhizobium sp. B2-3-14]